MSVEQIIVVALFPVEVELIGTFLDNWRTVIDLSEEIPETIEQLEKVINKLKSKLGRGGK